MKRSCSKRIDFVKEFYAYTSLSLYTFDDVFLSIALIVPQLLLLPHVPITFHISFATFATFARQRSENLFRGFGQRSNTTSIDLLTQKIYLIELISFSNSVEERLRAQIDGLCRHPITLTIPLSD